MKTDDKDKKFFNPATAAKGMTLAAMVAALGISVGTEVKNVYAQGNEFNGRSNILVADTIEHKGTYAGSAQEIKLTNQIVSGKIVSINGNQVTILDGNNKRWSWGVSLQSGGNSSEYLNKQYQVGDMISGQIVNGRLLLMDKSR